jgi:hypothetical protein
MVFRFFKDKKAAPIATEPPASTSTSTSASSSTSAAAPTPASTETGQEAHFESKDQGSSSTAANTPNTPAPSVDWDAVGKASATNAVASSVEQDPEDSEETKLAKATAATKSLSDFAQMASMRATAEDVIAAYKIFLGRLPESAQVVQQRMGPPVATLLIDFLASTEFLGHPERAKLILGLAKRVQEMQDTSASAVTSSTSSASSVSSAGADSSSSNT